MDGKEYGDLIYNIVTENCGLESKIQDVLTKYEGRIGKILEEHYPAKEIEQESECENIRAVPNSEYLSNKITKGIVAGEHIVNLDYDPRLRATGYTTALETVAKQFCGMNVVVVVNNYSQVYTIMQKVPNARVYLNRNTNTQGFIEHTGLVLVDNSVKQLTESMRLMLKDVSDFHGTVVTLNNLGL